MAGSKLHGSSSLSFLLQSDRICSQSLHSLLLEGSSSSGFLGSQSISFDYQESKLGQLLYRPIELDEACGDEDLDDSLLHQPEKKRRLTAGQVQFLEKSFEIENKLEPERKVQLAKDLGLQPRQVAIWFQNRRARWKTKQLEQEYEALKSSLDELKIEHEKLLKEKDQLEAEVLSLTNKLLLKEEDANGSIELFDQQKFQGKLRSTDSCLIITEKTGSGPGGCDVVGGDDAENRWKQEDLRSSSKSTTLDSESPHYSMIIEPNSCSSNALLAEQSELSQISEDHNEVKGCSLLDFENNPCSHPFQVGDQSFWFWP